MTFNVMGAADQLAKLLAKFPDGKVTDRFSATDVNISVPGDRVDDFVDAVEDLGLKWSML